MWFEGRREPGLVKGHVPPPSFPSVRVEMKTCHFCSFNWNRDTPFTSWTGSQRMTPIEMKVLSSPWTQPCLMPTSLDFVVIKANRFSVTHKPAGLGFSVIHNWKGPWASCWGLSQEPLRPWLHPRTFSCLPPGQNSDQHQCVVLAYVCVHLCAQAVGEHLLNAY